MKMVGQFEGLGGGFCGFAEERQIGENVSQYDTLYQNADGKLYKSDADDAAKMPIVAMAMCDMLADATALVFFYGTVTNAGWAWTIGAELYASGTLGELTETEPAISQNVATPITATSVLFMPSYCCLINATDSVRGLATDTQITKLDGIATGADVTSANAPLGHKDSHITGGSDVIDDYAGAGANGLVPDCGAELGYYLEDNGTWSQPVGGNHAATHEDGGGDEVSIAGLAGVASDDQHVIAAEAVAAVEAAGVDLASGKNIHILLALTSNLHYSGITTTGTVGDVGGVIIGDVLRHDQSENKWYKADADEVATSDGLLTMATTTIAQDASGILLLEGSIRYDTWDWTIDDSLRHLYIHTTGGSPTQTAPSGDADVVRVIGYPVTADILYFKPDNTYVVVEVA